MAMGTGKEWSASLTCRNGKACALVPMMILIEHAPVLTTTLQERALVEADQRLHRAWRGRLSANKGAEDYDDMDAESRWSRRPELPWIQSFVTRRGNETGGAGEWIEARLGLGLQGMAQVGFIGGAGDGRAIPSFRRVCGTAWMLAVQRWRTIREENEIIGWMLLSF
jgi:hypothetical protein